MTVIINTHLDALVSLLSNWFNVVVTWYAASESSCNKCSLFSCCVKLHTETSSSTALTTSLAAAINCSLQLGFSTVPATTYICNQ